MAFSYAAEAGELEQESDSEPNLARALEGARQTVGRVAIRSSVRGRDPARNTFVLIDPVARDQARLAVSSDSAVDPLFRCNQFFDVERGIRKIGAEVRRSSPIEQVENIRLANQRVTIVFSEAEPMPDRNVDL